VGGQLDVKPI